MVRQRGGKMGLSRIKLCRRDSSELLCRDEGETVDLCLHWLPSSPHSHKYTIILLRCFHGDHAKY